MMRVDAARLLAELPRTTVQVVVDAKGAFVARASSSASLSSTSSAAARVGTAAPAPPKPGERLASLIPASWHARLCDEFVKPYFAALETKVLNEYDVTTVYPPLADLFRALALVPLEQVRVVLLGQDPYIGQGQAHGLAFSCARGNKSGRAWPPALQNIVKELTDEYAGDFLMHNDGDLTKWAEQGVLLLNSVLSVKAGTPLSHSQIGWQRLTDRILTLVSSKGRPGIVFMLWGFAAKEKASLIRFGHHVLKSAHPGPKSADSGFFGCGHFVRCNQLLMERGEQPVEWGVAASGTATLRHPQASRSSVASFGSATTADELFGVGKQQSVCAAQMQDVSAAIAVDTTTSTTGSDAIDAAHAVYDDNDDDDRHGEQYDDIVDVAAYESIMDARLEAAVSAEDDQVDNDNDARLNSTSSLMAEPANSQQEYADALLAEARARMKLLRTE